MGQGEDKIARSLLDLQPTAIVEFYRIFPDVINKPSLSIDIHGGSIFKNPITWQGVRYLPVPIEAEGFEITANGKLPRPKIKVANKDFLVTSLLQNNSDFKNAEIIRKRTFVKYLDDTNFDAGNPFGEADSSAEISEEKYVIGQKTQENRVFVEFELTSPLDLENFEVNHRRILGKYCYWTYRGRGCRYEGPPINQEDGEGFKVAGTGDPVVPLETSDQTEFNTNDAVFQWNPSRGYNISDISYIENSKVMIHPIGGGPPGTPLPMKTWYVCVSGNTGQRPEDNPTYWAKDGCNKKLSSCKLRFNDEGTIKYETFGTEHQESFVKISGYHNAREDATRHHGFFLSSHETVTGFYRNSDGTNKDWTIALYVDLINAGKTWSAYLDTRTGWWGDLGHPTAAAPGAPDEGPETVDVAEDLGKLVWPNDKRRNIYARVPIKLSNNTFRSAFLYFGPNVLSRRRLMALSYDSTLKELKTYSYQISGDIVTPNETLQIESQFGEGADVHIISNCFSLGANLNAFDHGAAIATRTAHYSPEADYIGCAIWQKKLDDSQIGNLLQNVNEKAEDENGNLIEGDTFSTFKNYSDTSTDLRDNLVAWWGTGRFNSAGESASNPLFTSENDDGTRSLTGYHDVFTGGKSYMRPVTVEHERTVQYYHLPFGGFPGTDGFTFQA